MFWVNQANSVEYLLQLWSKFSKNSKGAAPFKGQPPTAHNLSPSSINFLYALEQKKGMGLDSYEI